MHLIFTKIKSTMVLKNVAIFNRGKWPTVEGVESVELASVRYIYELLHFKLFPFRLCFDFVQIQNLNKHVKCEQKPSWLQEAKIGGGDF